MLGKTLLQYRIVDKLGEGGGGTVYKAQDTKLNRTVVVKTLAEDLAHDTAGRHRFLREARLASALDHPNICTIYDISEAEGVYFIAMQFAEGRTLKQVISKRPLDLRTSLTVAIQLADALAFAHEHGIIHRDIKPANVMISANSQCKILDFGLAKDAAPKTAPSEELTAHGALLGTPSYMSPEQARGESLDHRTDIFSLGAVIYEMFTGERAFKGKSRIEVLNSVLTVTPTPVKVYDPSTPQMIDQILARALAKNPSGRYASMRQMREDLKRAMRLHLQETGSIPGEASADLAAPQHAERSWLKTGPLGRMLGRLRRGAPAGSANESHDEISAERSDPDRSASSWRTKEKKALAILPFRNLSRDPETDFYGFSLADSVITELARLRALTVVPSSYVAQYQNRDLDPRLIGRELSVDAVLIGGFLKAAGRFRVTPQLVDIVTGEILWSDKIDVDYSDIITLQDEISRSIVEGLKVRISSTEEDQLARSVTTNPEAYELFLRGRNLLLKSTLQTYRKEDLDEAVRMFRSAIDLDPQFGLAHSALGRCYTNYVIRGIGGQAYYQEARKTLGRALELEPRYIEPRLFMIYNYLVNGEKVKARSEIRELLRLAPNDHMVHAVAANIFRWDGLYDLALREYEIRIELFPQAAPEGYTGRGRLLTFQGRYAEAESEFRRGLELEPNHSALKTFLSIARYFRGNVMGASEMLHSVLQSNPAYQTARIILAWCLITLGNRDEARGLINDQVKDLAMADGDAAYMIASYYALLGERDEAIGWLKNAIKVGNENYPWFVRDPNWAALRSDPQLISILSELRERWQSLVDSGR